MSATGLVCEVRYHIDPDKLDAFREYARLWTVLIDRHGGHHQGYLLSRAAPARAGMSFPGLGDEASGLVAVARFSFADEAAYLHYRNEVQKDPDGIAANARYRADPPFLRYERSFFSNLP